MLYALVSRWTRVLNRVTAIKAGTDRPIRTTWISTAFALAGIAVLATAPAQAGPNGQRYAAIAVDAMTGEVVFARNADDLRYPASITKVMTLYMLFEELEAGRLRLDSKLPVSRRAAAQPPSKIGVRAGSTIKVEDAILALVTKSANDVATVVAEAIAGSEEEFAKRMTARAISIGMTKTTFRNASGLPNSGQVSTARDLAVLGRQIQWRFPRYYDFFKTRSFAYRGARYRNHNRLLGNVPGVDGIKTGFIRASGFNLLTSMRRDGRHIVAVVMGGRTGASRNAEMRRVLDLAVKRIPRRDEMLMAAAPRRLPVDQIPLPRANPRNGMMVAAVPGATLANTNASAVRADDASEMPILAAATPSPSAPIQLPLPRREQPEYGSIDDSNDALKTASVATTTIRVPSRIVNQDDDALGVFLANTLESVPSAVPPPAVQAPTAQTAFATPAPQPVQIPAAVQAPQLAEPVMRSGWIIQIGAYNDEAAALRNLELARDRLNSELNGADPFTETVTKDGTVLWRARFAGFDRSGAKAACDALKRQNFGCFAARL